jgi:tRNA1Val (adenine37-N6)-methyltransferase
MGNTYFQFKQFTIHQDKTAMRVCTDACLFGAIVASEISANMVLDIGAGTGLLSLMYAQKHSNSIIDAVELEENAFAQAHENVAISPWKNNIQIHNNAIQGFEPKESYDLILSNPPFFENDLKSAKNERNLAMHSETLTLKELFSYANKYLSESGKFAVLIPFHRLEYTLTIAKENDFYLGKIWNVKQTETHPFFRSILIFQKENTETDNSELYIKNTQNQYGIDFAHYLKDYYLFL